LRQICLAVQKDGKGWEIVETEHRKASDKQQAIIRTHKENKRKNESWKMSMKKTHILVGQNFCTGWEVGGNYFAD